MTDRRRTLIALIVMASIGVYIRVTERLGPDAIPPVASISATDLVPSLTTATVQPRMIAGFGALFLAGVFFLLYLYRRRTFIAQWTRGWLYLAGAMFVLARGDAESPTRLVVGISGMLAISSAFTFIKGGESLRGLSRNTRLHTLLVILVLVWYVLARLFITRAAAYAGAYVALAALLGLASYHYIRLARDRRLLGAAMVALMLAIVASSHAVMAFTVNVMARDTGFTFGMLSTNLVGYTAAALGMFVLVFEDLTTELRDSNRVLRATQDELRELAVTDPLTGCHNRRHLHAVIGRELKRHRRFGIPLSMLFIDVDRFKQVNDTAGHDAGDRVLVHVSTLLRAQVREFDLVVRWGGDEFLVLLSCGAADATRKAAELKRRFQATIAAHDLPDVLRLSIGVVEVPPETTDIMPLVKIADERMYADKTAEA